MTGIYARLYDAWMERHLAAHERCEAPGCGTFASIAFNSVPLCSVHYLRLVALLGREAVELDSDEDVRPYLGRLVD